MTTRIWLPLLMLPLGASLIGAPISIREPNRNDRIDFAREIYPLLKRNCLACHNSTKAKADLNLESPDLMRKGGESGPVIVAGKADESLLLKSAAHLEEPPMPPPGNKVKATDFSPDELGLLKRWIDQGAQGEALLAEKGPLPWRADAEHGGAVNALAISPNGRLAAIARGNSVQLRDVATGRLAAQLRDPDLNAATVAQPMADRDAVMALAFADDDLLATGGFRTVRIWRRMPRATKRDYGAWPEEPTAVAVSADGKWAVSGSKSGAIWLSPLDAEKFEPVALKECAAPVVAVAFDPGSESVIAASDDGNIVVWRTADRMVTARLKSSVGLRSIAVDRPGTELLAGGTDGTLRIWPWPFTEAADVAAAPTRELKLSETPLTAIAPVEEGALWWIGPDHALHLVSVRDGSEQRRITAEHPMARAVASADHALKSAQAHRQSQAARLASIAERLKKETEAARTAAQTAVKRRVEAEQLREARALAEERVREKPDDKTRTEQAKKAGEAERKAEAGVRAAKVDAEIAARLLGATAQEHAVVQLGEAAAEAAVMAAQTARDSAAKLMSGALPAPRHLAVAADGTSALVTDEKGAVRHIALHDGALLESMHNPAIGALFANDHIWLVGADKHLLQTASARPWARERVIGQADDPTVIEDRVNALAFSPDGRLLATGGGTPSRTGELKLWRTDGTLVRQVPRAHTDTVNAIVFSPDGDLLATAGSDRLVCIWSAIDGTRIASLEGHSGHVLSIAWRADGMVLASGGADKSVRTWDVTARKQIKAVTNFGGEVCAVRFVGTGDLLLAAAGDKTVRLGEQTLAESGAAYPFCAAADRAGELVAAGGHDGKVRFWKVADRKLIRTVSCAAPEEARTAAAP